MSLFDGICRCPFWVSVLEQKSSNRWGRKEDLQLKKTTSEAFLFVVWTRIWLRINCDHDSMNAGIWSNVLYCFFWPKAIMFEVTKHFKEAIPIFLKIFFIWSSWTQLNPHEKMDVALSWYLKISLGAAGTGRYFRVPLISTWKNTPEIWDTKNSHLSKESTFFQSLIFFALQPFVFGGCMYLRFPVLCNIVKPRGSTSERWRMTRPIAFSQAAMRPLRITVGSLQWQDVHEPNEPVGVYRLYRSSK